MARAKKVVSITEASRALTWLNEIIESGKTAKDRKYAEVSQTLILGLHNRAEYEAAKLDHMRLDLQDARREHRRCLKALSKKTSPKR